MPEPAHNEEANTEEVLRVLRSTDETRRFYNKISRVYDLLAERSEEPVRIAGLEYLDVQPGERALEIGFGTGHSLVRLAQSVGPDGRVDGVDLSDGMLELATQRLREAGLLDRVHLAAGDASTLTYGDDTVDAAFMSFTLELFDTDDIPAVLCECRRVLRPGGRLVVVAVSKEGEDGIAIRAYEWTHEHFPNLLDCRPIFVRRSLEAAGFRIAKATKRTMWVPVEIVLAVKPSANADGQARS